MNSTSPDARRFHRSKRLLSAGLLAFLLASNALPQEVASPDEAYRFLVGLIEKGLYDMAVEEARSFLREHPAHPKAMLARYRLATALFELGKREEAAPHFKTLAEEDGFEYRSECAFRLGECELERARYDVAGAAFAAVLDGDQTYLHEAARFFLGDALFRQGEIDDAERRFAELLDATPNSTYAPRARASLAWCAWQRKDAGLTERRARDFLARHAKDEVGDEIRVLLGEALLEEKKAGEALEVFRTVQAEALDDAKRRGIAFALVQGGDRRGAAREFRALYEAHPESRFAAEARLEAGVQTLLDGAAEEALPLLSESAEDGAGEALYWLARAQEATGRSEDALKTLERARKGASGELLERIQVARGDALRSLGRSEDAIAAYEGAGSEYSLYAAAVTALEEHRTEDAIRIARGFLERHPDSQRALDARLVLGEALFERRAFDEASRAFGEVLALAPPASAAAQAKNRLAWCRYLAGDLAGARQGFEALVRDHPSEPPAEEGLALLARVDFESGANESAFSLVERYLRAYPQGRYGDQVLSLAARAKDGLQGLSDLERLVRDFPQSPLVPEASLQIAERLSAAGRHDEAARRYRELLERDPSSPRVAEARYGLAWCEFQSQRFESAAETAKQVADDRGAPEELRASAAELLVWAESRALDADGAAAAWRLLIALPSPEEKRLECARAVVTALRQNERLAEARTILDECLRAVRDPETVLLTLLEGAYLALEEGDVDRADAQVEAAERRQARSSAVAEASFFVGEARAERGDRERALALYTRASAAENPRKRDALYKLGYLELAAGHLASASRAFEELIADPASPLFGESLFLLGETRFREGRFDEAARLLERLRREVPRHEVLPKGLFRLGIALGELGRWPEAEAVLAELARSQPEFPNLAEAELWRGRALAAQKKARPARAAFERVVALDSGSLAANARLALARMTEDEGRFEDALSEYLKVALLYADEEAVAEALFRAGTCLERLGRNEQAIARFREVVENHPRSSFAEEAERRLRGAPARGS